MPFMGRNLTIDLGRMITFNMIRVILNYNSSFKICFLTSKIESQCSSSFYSNDSLVLSVATRLFTIIVDGDLPSNSSSPLQLQDIVFYNYFNGGR